ncbi:MAG: prephenate dehydrogenase [Flavobacteriaceae bacterium]|nr:prephenate dehydrogenase [Flavobacteriaceae bacterium]|tara:strand:- start:116130 stop:116978 length:849 start_codon:yes stop_codon:yes gene_type:complete
MKVYVIGLGLIGGSLSKDIKDAFKDAVVYGFDKNPENVKKALEIGFIDHAFEMQDLSQAEVVIVAIPVDAQQKVLPQVLDRIGDDTLVFDAGSTKEKLCKLVANHPKRRNFLATHPIAGTEFSGPEAAINGLFQNKTNIICEVEKTAFKLQEKGLEIFRRIGMRIRYMDPVAHDKHIAYVSHLSHISSFMLGKTVIDKEQNERDIFDMAGSGFESTVRLAKSSPAMWTPIFKENKENILETLQEYIQNLEHFKNLMEEDQFEEVFKTMENTNHIKTILKGIQ